MENIKQLLEDYHKNIALKKTLQSVIFECNENILAANAILNLTDNKTYQTILINKFILNINIVNISEQINYSVRHTERLYKKALQELENKLK